MNMQSRALLGIGVASLVGLAVVAYLLRGSDDDVGTRVAHVIGAHSLPYLGDAETMLFHTQNCSKAQRVPERRQIHFQTRAAAIDRGFITCGSCNPRGQ